MECLLDQVRTFEGATSPERFAELSRIFPIEHFEGLGKAGFRFCKATFWYVLDQKPANVFEALIADLQPLAAPSSEVIGVEWWFSVVHTNKSPMWLLPPHFDRSDLSEKDPARLRYPERASVLFLNSVPYGELVVTDQVMSAKGIEPKQPNSVRFIQPKENRYAVFPGQLYHGVIGRMWRPAEPSALRVAMAVNWWREKPKAAYLRDSRDCVAAFQLLL